MTTKSIAQKQKGKRQIFCLPLKFREEWDNFVSSVILVILLPLLPLLLELIATESIEPTSVTLMASSFTLALGISSKSKSFLAFSISIGVIYAPLYMLILTIQKHNFPDNIVDYIQYSSFVVIFFAVFFHGWERLTRHVLNNPKETFLNFWYGKEEIRDEKISIRKNKNKIEKELTEILCIIESCKREKDLMSDMKNKENLKHFDSIREEVKNIQDKIKKSSFPNLTLDELEKKKNELETDFDKLAKQEKDLEDEI